MCNCKNIIPQSSECYAQQVVLPIPPHMREYRLARVRAGLSTSICIDPCIVEEIQYLWAKGIITYGCCCGHNMAEPFVNVDESQSALMLQLGYEMNHPDKSRIDTFRLKSVLVGTEMSKEKETSELEKEKARLRGALAESINVLKYFEYGLTDVREGSGQYQPMHRETCHAIDIAEQALNKEGE